MRTGGAQPHMRTAEPGRQAVVTIATRSPTVNTLCPYIYTLYVVYKHYASIAGQKGIIIIIVHYNHCAFYSVGDSRPQSACAATYLYQ